MGWTRDQPAYETHLLHHRPSLRLDHLVTGHKMAAGRRSAQRTDAALATGPKRRPRRIADTPTPRRPSPVVLSRADLLRLVTALRATAFAAQSSRDQVVSVGTPVSSL